MKRQIRAEVRDSEALSGRLITHCRVAERWVDTLDYLQKIRFTVLGFVVYLCRLLDKAIPREEFFAVHMEKTEEGTIH